MGPSKKENTNRKKSKKNPKDFYVARAGSVVRRDRQEKTNKGKKS